MKQALFDRLLARKSVARLVEEAESRSRLKRVLGPWALIFLGLGATIGTGIFVLAGKAAKEEAGPALVLSFGLAAVGCALAAVAYAEVAGMVPVSGSAYTYAYATLGELFAWVIGWLLILEYSVSAAAVAQGWTNYASDLFRSSFGLSLDPKLLHAPWDFDYAKGVFVLYDAYLNLPAMLVVWFITAFIILGIKESARFNTAILAVNLFVIVVVLCVGSTVVDPRNWTPFFHSKKGVFGVFSGASIIFFAFIGFDATATYAEEAKRPRRDLPIGILGSLAVCTFIYIGMTLVLTGLSPLEQIDADAPFASAFRAKGFESLSRLIGVGVIAATTNVVLVGMVSQSRIFLAMVRDGLLPERIFGAIHPRFQTPVRSQLLIGLFVSLAAALAPLNLLAELVNLGTLLIFVIVSIAVVVLRRTQPDAPRTFRAPFVHLVAGLGILVNLSLMATAGWRQALGLVIWAGVGVCVYFLYGVRHSKLNAPD